MKSDNEPALTSWIESWSTLRAMKSGSRMMIENSLVGSSKSSGIVETAIKSVQERIRTLRSAIEEQRATDVAVDRRTCQTLADKVRNRSRRQIGVRATEREIRESAGLVLLQKESCGRGDEQEVSLES